VPRQRPSLQFLPPLPIKITGIIASNKEENSQVTIMNNNSRKTTSHKVGDTVMDASVLRIFPRKVILLRSNGQQETLFMYQEDAKAEMSELKDVTWHDVVQRQTEIRFLINPTSFASRIATLAELIDALDALPATKEGEALGIRVGKMDRTSVGFALGFQPGDLITHIADIPTTSTEDRMKAYNKVVQLKIGSSCVVKGKRKGRPLMHTYTLFNLADEGATQKAPAAPTFGPSGPQGSQQMPMPNQTNQSGFAQPTQAPQDMTQAMQRRDREAMNMYGAKQSAMPFDMEQGALQ
jgi:type II secretory pathway component PulC